MFYLWNVDIGLYLKLFFAFLLKPSLVKVLLNSNLMFVKIFAKLKQVNQAKLKCCL